MSRALKDSEMARINMECTEVHFSDELEHYRSVFKSIPDLLFEVDRDGRYLNVWSHHPDLLAAQKERLLGRTVGEILESESAAAAMEAIREADENGTAYGHVLLIRQPDGEIRWYDHSLAKKTARSPAEDTFIVLSRDITERKHMEAQIVQERAMLRAFFDALPDLVWIKDTEGRFLACNQRLESVFGARENEIIGKTDFDFLDTELAAFYRTKDKEAEAAAQPCKNEEWIRCSDDGRRMRLETVKAAVRDSEGRVVGVIGVGRDITERRQMEETLLAKTRELSELATAMEHRAQHDVLTGLPNRALLADRIRQGIAHARRSGEMLAVAYLDLDGFKPINDRHGHSVGDQVLKALATRMSNVLRAADTVARIGGDEFVLLLPGQSSVSDTETTLRRLHEAIGEPLHVDDHVLSLTASIGVSRYPDDGDDPDLLLRNADQVMYAAKQTGRNQFMFYGQEMRERSKVRGPMLLELRKAIEQDQIAVHYQPIICLSTGRVCKAEALARWTHPERGAVSPAEFIPLAEDAGLIHALGANVFRNIVRVAKALNQASSPVNKCDALYRIGFNRSPRQFFRGDDIDTWAGLLREAGVSGRMLSMEITEGLLLDNRPKVIEQLDRIRDMGITVSLDDFGTGYSALSYLKKFKIDFLKIDRSFVSDIDKNESDRAIVESIIVMAHRLGMRLIAEGVETEAQARLLAAAGCDLAQGYFYARPMPEREFLDFVRATEAAPLPPFTRQGKAAPVMPPARWNASAEDQPINAECPLRSRTAAHRFNIQEPQ